MRAFCKVLPGCPQHVYVTADDGFFLFHYRGYITFPNAAQRGDIFDPLDNTSIIWVIVHFNMDSTRYIINLGLTNNEGHSRARPIVR